MSYQFINFSLSLSDLTSTENPLRYTGFEFVPWERNYFTSQIWEAQQCKFLNTKDTLRAIGL